jgi:hypothetical protein
MSASAISIFVQLGPIYTANTRGLPCVPEAQSSSVTRYWIFDDLQTVNDGTLQELKLLPVHSSRRCDATKTLRQFYGDEMSQRFGQLSHFQVVFCHIAPISYLRIALCWTKHGGGRVAQNKCDGISCLILSKLAWFLANSPPRGDKPSA